jgi:hypothetical protein
MYAYYLGEIFETSEILSKRVKQIVSNHYFQTAVRIYYIFEWDPTPIYRTKEVTLSMIRQLTSVEYRSLTLNV